MSSVKFYRTFGQSKGMRRRWRMPAWMALAIAIFAILAAAGIMILLTRTYRTDFENRSMPPYNQNVAFALSGTRFRVGDTGYLTLRLNNPGAQTIRVKSLELDVPPRFLDAFTVDDVNASVQRAADSSGTVTYANIKVLPGTEAAVTVPMHATQAGNFGGEIQLTLQLAVPVPNHPWFINVDRDGNYIMTLHRSINRELTIVPKP
jgi:hypothetical protein